MKNILFLIVTFVFAVQCTNKAQKVDPSKIQVNSPFGFKYNSKLAGTENIAMVGEEPVTLSQLMSPSAALRDLEQRLQVMILEKIKVDTAESQSIKAVVGFEPGAETLKSVFGVEQMEGITTNHTFGFKNYSINGKLSSTTDLGASTRLFTQLQEQYFTLRVRALEGIVSRRFILNESKAQKMTMEDYINKNVLGTTFTVSQQEVDTFVQKNNIEWGKLDEKMQKQVADTVKGKKRQKLVTEFVAKQLKAPIAIGFEKPIAKIQLPKLDESVAEVGAGPIEITVFSGVNCKGCLPVNSNIIEFTQKNTSEFNLKHVFSFPSNNNEEKMVSEASLCLKKQKEDYFWSFLSEFQAESDLEKQINEKAKSLGADYDAFRACFLAREFKSVVESHLAGAKSVGLYASPVVVINGVVMEKPETTEVMSKLNSMKKKKLGFFDKIKALFGA